MRSERVSHYRRGVGGDSTFISARECVVSGAALMGQSPREGEREVHAEETPKLKYGLVLYARAEPMSEMDSGNMRRR